MSPPTASQQQIRKRVIHQLDTPFSTVRWPEIAQEDQDTILELLCELLSPVGRHRHAHVTVSKGKRAAAKRKKSTDGRPATPPEVETPPKPQIADRIDVGFNSITRRLGGQPELPSRARESGSGGAGPYSMVFVARGDQSPAFNCHFPKMIAASDGGVTSSGVATRLVGLSKPCSQRLGVCLGVPQVSSVAVERDAPGSEALWQVVQKTVPAVEAAWLSSTNSTNAGAPHYQTTKINALETTIGVKRVKSC